VGDRNKEQFGVRQVAQRDHVAVRARHVFVPVGSAHFAEVTPYSEGVVFRSGSLDLNSQNDPVLFCEDVEGCVGVLREAHAPPLFN
jgi:hypothetical protein